MTAKSQTYRVVIAYNRHHVLDVICTNLSLVLQNAKSMSIIHTSQAHFPIYHKPRSVRRIQKSVGAAAVNIYINYNNEQ